MTKLYRILGKRGRITIPFEIRQRVGFSYNDVLSFTESPDGRTVTVKREKICDNCSGTKTADKETEMTLEDFLDSLSAEQQRVALARALVIEPSVLLFDEPLSNLDAKLRVSMRTEIRRIQQEVGITAIYVTHDQSEAMALSDQIIIMNKGVVAQVGTPQEIYYHPNSEFVADFIGEANFLKGSFVRSTDNGRAVMNIEGGEIEVAPQGELEAGHEYTLVLRPEAAALGEEGGLPCRVVLSCFMGSYQNYHVMVGDTLVKLTDPNPKNKKVYQVGDTCRLVFDPENVHVL